MTMPTAARIEPCPASWALIAARQVISDCQLVAADAAKDGGRVPLLRGPHLCGVGCEGVVAVAAGVVRLAAAHFDRNDV